MMRIEGPCSVDSCQRCIYCEEDNIPELDGSVETGHRCTLILVYRKSRLPKSLLTPDWCPFYDQEKAVIAPPVAAGTRSRRLAHLGGKDESGSHPGRGSRSEKSL